MVFDISRRKTGMNCERLYGSPIVVVWSQGIYVVELRSLWVVNCMGRLQSRDCRRFRAICGGRAKVCIGCVMLVGRRKFVYRNVI